MKKIILTTAILLCAISVSAQIRLGVRGGMDLKDTKIRTQSLAIKNNLGFQAGVVLEALVPVSGLGGEVSVLYGSKEFKASDVANDASISNYKYIMIPVHLKQRIKLLPDLGLFFSGGPYAEARLEGGDITQKLNTALKTYKSKNFAMGISLAAGVQVLKHLNASIEFRGELTNRYSSEYMDAGIFQDKKYQTWSAGVTYFF